MADNMTDNLDPCEQEPDEDMTDIFADVSGVQEVGLNKFKPLHDEKSDGLPKRPMQNNFGRVDESSEQIKNRLQEAVDDMGMMYLISCKSMVAASKDNGFAFKQPDAFDLSYYDDQFVYWFQFTYPNFAEDYLKMCDQDKNTFKVDNYRASSLLNKYKNYQEAVKEKTEEEF